MFLFVVFNLVFASGLWYVLYRNKTVWMSWFHALWMRWGVKQTTFLQWFFYGTSITIEDVKQKMDALVGVIEKTVNRIPQAERVEEALGAIDRDLKFLKQKDALTLVQQSQFIPANKKQAIYTSVFYRLIEFERHLQSDFYTTGFIVDATSLKSPASTTDSILVLGDLIAPPRQAVYQQHEYPQRLARRLRRKPLTSYNEHTGYENESRRVHHKRASSSSSLSLTRAQYIQGQYLLATELFVLVNDLATLLLRDIMYVDTNGNPSSQTVAGMYLEMIRLMSRLCSRDILETNEWYQIMAGLGSRYAFVRNNIYLDQITSFKNQVMDQQRQLESILNQCGKEPAQDTRQKLLALLQQNTGSVHQTLRRVLEELYIIPSCTSGEQSLTTETTASQHVSSVTEKTKRRGNSVRNNAAADSSMRSKKRQSLAPLVTNVVWSILRHVDWYQVVQDMFE